MDCGSPISRNGFMGISYSIAVSSPTTIGAASTRRTSNRERTPSGSSRSSTSAENAGRLNMAGRGSAAAMRISTGPWWKKRRHTSHRSSKAHGNQSATRISRKRDVCSPSMVFRSDGGLPEMRSGTRYEGKVFQISLTRRGRTKVGPENKSTMQCNMAWRPYSNLIDGELDNRVPGKVTGWMRFIRQGKQNLKVVFDLTGDFHEDIRGKLIRRSNAEPSDKYQGGTGTYMDGFARVQRGTVGDITAGISLGPWTVRVAERLMAQNELLWDEAGTSQAEREKRRQEFAGRYRAHIQAGDLFYPYVQYPYIEWYADNGRVVLELDPSQVEIVESAQVEAKSPKELVADERKRVEAMGAFLGTMVKEVSRRNREQGGDGNVAGVLVE